MNKHLKFLYDCWMKFARILGKIQTAILLFFIYFFGIGIISIISFIFRKDFLDKRFTECESFWHDRINKTPSLEDSARQF